MDSRSRSSSLSSLDSLLSELSFSSYDSTSGSASTLSIATHISSPLLLVEELEVEQLFEEFIEAIEDNNLFLQFLISLMEPDSDGAAGSFHCSSNAAYYLEFTISVANGSSDSADMSPSPEAANILPKDDEDWSMLPLYLDTPALSLYNEQEATPQQEESTSSLHYATPSIGASLVYSVSTKHPPIVFLRSEHLTELEQIALNSLEPNISGVPLPMYTPEAHSPTEMTLLEPPAFADPQPPPYEPSLELSSSGSSMASDYLYDNDAQLFSSDEISTIRDIYNNFNNLLHRDALSSDRLFITDANNFTAIQLEETDLGGTSSYGLLQHFLEMESEQMFGFKISNPYSVDEDRM
ncbi:uncharacterized protein V1513DRAFT_420577 [Lipomyces chichibuensis]|uniref:uncharacterized protein n=1 Tax=Lipomyces chichibuensis TaxID=1546026 RepID=UPI003343512D